MPYTMRMHVDGGCRRNGQASALGAAAALIIHRNGATTTRKRALPSSPLPTNQRAELTAIVLALELAYQKSLQLANAPYMKVTIVTDSKYAYGCMTDWSFKWRRNGWRNSAGRPVANQDLVKKAIELQEQVEMAGLGKVKFEWVPRKWNFDADEAVNDKLDELEVERERERLRQVAADEDSDEGGYYFLSDDEDSDEDVYF